MSVADVSVMRVVGFLICLMFYMEFGEIVRLSGKQVIKVFMGRGEFKGEID